MQQPKRENLSRLAQLLMYKSELEYEHRKARMKGDQQTMDRIEADFVANEFMIMKERGDAHYLDKSGDFLLMLFGTIFACLVAALLGVGLMMEFLRWIYL